MPDPEPNVSPDSISWWNGEDQYVTIDLYPDGTLEFTTTGRNYRDCDYRDLRQGVDVRFSVEDSRDFAAALQAWLEQL